jgi:hypothetical protein
LIEILSPNDCHNFYDIFIQHLKHKQQHKNYLYGSSREVPPKYFFLPLEL